MEFRGSLRVNNNSHLENRSVIIPFDLAPVFVEQVETVQPDRPVELDQQFFRVSLSPAPSSRP